MFQRPFLFLLVLAAAGLVPYVLMDKDLSANARSFWNSATGTAATNPHADAAQAIDQFASQLIDGGQAWQQQLVSQNLAPIPLEQALRFDVSLPWVTAVFPRVTTVLGDTQLQGLRVPLVSGTQEHDVAGSLTYYFDREQVLRRITFQGYTGDDRRLVVFICTTHGLMAQPTLDRGLYRTVGPHGEVSTMLLRHAPVVSNDQSKKKVEVTLDLVRGPLPKGYKLPEFRAPGQESDEIITPNLAATQNGAAVAKSPAEAAPPINPANPAANPAGKAEPAAKPASSPGPRPTWRW